MKIRKDIKFDCCHMLSGYEGKCANLHGHTYHGTVTINAPVDDTTRMVLDYNIIKKIVDMFDHAIIFSSALRRNAAEQELYEWADRNQMRMYVMPSEYPKTTAEDMSQVLARTLKHEEPLGASWEVTVSLSETDGSWAEAAV
jgi:6-pyruvoyltetrahydropterin/6-carboxytetrahydropterin synthase